MQTDEIERLRSIRTFPSLVKYLRDELDWPIESEDFDKLIFDYEPKELGLDSKIAVKIEEIKQLRPLTSPQPWGIFFIKFAPKRLPVVALRRALQSLVTKRRESANKADRRTWHQSDLLFISSYGEDGDRAITFAHFTEDKEIGRLPILRVLGWDKLDAPLHIADAHDQLKEKLHWPEDEGNLEQWRKTWASAFILRHHEIVDTSKDLATRLADLASTIRGRVNQVLVVENPKTGPVRQLFQAFQETLIHDLDEDDFADTYAQTIAYGLLAAAIEQHEPDKKTLLVVDKIADMIPATNPFLKELLGTFITISGRKKRIDFDELGINEVVDMLNNANLTAVKHDFGRLAKKDDPIFYFYEDFIHEYDAKKRKRRGIYFTPPPVVSFIVRSVDEILRKDFGLEDGLADTITWGEMQKKNKNIKTPDGVKPSEPFVQILDPATGTGTFLVETIGVIYKEMTAKWEREGHLPLEFDKLWNEYVPKHLLPRLYGFELMMAPYAIAHMKIGLKLKETGYRFDSHGRLRIYLTNTLEEPKTFSEEFQFVSPALANEVKAASTVKRAVPITVIIGNPPYSNYGRLNRNEWILGLLDSYKRNLNEKKINIDDDFIKFVRYGQWAIEKSSIGILGYISNNCYIDGLTHRGMRRSLLSTFNRIRILDLHGNISAKEKDENGQSDENVFDIQQGVCIGLMTKQGRVSNNIFHAELKGPRKLKYDALVSHTNIQESWQKLTKVKEPWFFFVPKDFSLSDEYRSYRSIQEIFNEASYGIQTKRDAVTITFEKRVLIEIINDFIALDIEHIREKYNLPKDGRDWAVAWAKQHLTDITKPATHLRKVLYRPFDFRWIFYDNKSKGFVAYPRFSTMKHMLRDNLALIAMRQVFQEYDIYSHVGITNTLIDERTFYSNRGGTYLFPLYHYEPKKIRIEEGLSLEYEDWQPDDNGKIPNISFGLAKEMATCLKLELLSNKSRDLTKTIGPEDLFQYMYAVLLSPTYRKRYDEFLKIDFPRVPITSNTDMFRTLCGFGDELVALHLMESDKLNDHITTFPVSGDNAVSKVGEKGKTLAVVENGKGKLYINTTQYFDGLPEEIWNFHIGGYQVCHKWLADRKKADRKLSSEDIEHYHKIVVAINETVRIMKQIDETIATHGGWPIK